MDLTAWQRICHRLLGGVFKKRARADKELSDNLVKASMPMMPEVYLATVLVTTVVISAIGAGFVALFFVPEIGVIDLWESQQDPATEAPCFEWEYWFPDQIDESKPGNGCPEYKTRVFSPILKVLLVVIGAVVVPIVAWRYNKSGAKREAKRRGDMIEKYLPYASSYTAAMSAANATPAKIFLSLIHI